MAFAKVPYRLVSRQNLAKADVESVYGQLVQIIGGTYYLNGVAQGPVNGSLDSRNFAADAGILNAQKSNPYSLWALPLLIQGSNNQTYDIAISSATSDFPGSLMLASATAVCSGFSAATSVGNIQLQYYALGATSATNIGAAISWSSPATTTTILGSVTANMGLSPDTTLRAVISLSANPPPNNPIVVFFMKSLHVK